MEAETTQQLLLQHVRQLSSEVAELKREGGASLTDNLAHWLAAQFVVAAKTAAEKAPEGALDLKTLRGLSADLVALRRGDHTADRLKLDWQKQEYDAAKAAMKHAKEIKLILKDDSLTSHERVQQIRRLMFGEPSDEALKMMNLTREEWRKNDEKPFQQETPQPSEATSINPGESD